VYPFVEAYPAQPILFGKRRSGKCEEDCRKNEPKYSGGKRRPELFHAGIFLQ
jgi:hypothetical protein